MSFLSKVLSWISLLSLLFAVGMCTRVQHDQLDNIESTNAELITDLNQIQREIEWTRDSLNRQLDALITKANKYDSLMNLKDGKRRHKTSQ